MTMRPSCNPALGAALLLAMGCGLNTGGVPDEDADATVDEDGETGGEVGADADADEGADADADEGTDADADEGADADADEGTDTDEGADADADVDGDADVVVECVGPADCDDGLSCTIDSCELAGHTCRHEVDHAACDDGVDCTVDSCDPAAGGCVNAANDGACDDGDPCSGAETCDPALGCRPGTPPDCDDGVACTVDTCAPGTGACLNTPDDAACSDGAFCNGAEVCVAGTGCAPGAAPSCDDGLACSTDSCDPAAGGGAGACVNLGPDADGDSYRDAACGGTDCDDTRAAIRPGATETCDGVDQDCSGYPDDVAGTCPGCTPGVHGGHAYQFCTANVWWTTGRDRCAGVSGYYLTTVNDAAENGFLASTAAGVAAVDWWIGYNDRGSEGTWVWVSGSSSYTNWAADEPNDAGGYHAENCANLNQARGTGGQWNDADCGDTHPYICEHN